MSQIPSRQQSVGISHADAPAPRHVSGRRGLRVAATPEFYLLGAVVVLFVIGAATTSGFVDGDNVSAILSSAAITGIAAIAMTPLVLSGNFVSVASSPLGALAAVVFVATVGAGAGSVLAGLAALATLVVIGLVQGLVVSAGLNPVLMSLAAAAIVTGALASATDGQNLTVKGRGTSWGDASAFGLQVSVYVFAGVAIATTLLMSKTVLGRQIMLVGSNRRTALLSGISITRITVAAFVVFSVGVAICGVLWGAQLGVAGVGSLPTLTVDAVATVLIGGNSIAGGSGSPLRSAGGALLIAVATNIMLLHDVSDGVQQTVVGAVVLVVVLILQIINTRTSR